MCSQSIVIFNLHFTGELDEAQMGYVTGRGHTVTMLQSQDLNLGLSDSKTKLLFLTPKTCH